MFLDLKIICFLLFSQGSNKSWPITCLAIDILEEAHKRNVVIQPIRVTSEENLLAGKEMGNSWNPLPIVYPLFRSGILICFPL